MIIARFSIFVNLNLEFFAGFADRSQSTQILTQRGKVCQGARQKNLMDKAVAFTLRPYPAPPQKNA